MTSFLLRVPDALFHVIYVIHVHLSIIIAIHVRFPQDWQKRIAISIFSFHCTGIVEIDCL